RVRRERWSRGRRHRGLLHGLPARRRAGGRRIRPEISLLPYRRRRVQLPLARPRRAGSGFAGPPPRTPRASALGGARACGAGAALQPQHVPLPRSLARPASPSDRPIEFAPMDDYTSRVGDLKVRRKKNLAMGGEEKVAKQREKGKLTVRERLDLLFDPGTFVELGLLAQNRDGSDTAPADGVVTGHGDVDGRQVWVIAYDFTVMAGSMGAVGEQFKAARVRELALRYRKPLVWLLDSAGARIQEAAGSTFAGTGWLFADQVYMSGVIPQVAAMLGPCAAGTAYIPGLADFVPMVKGTSSMALGGARLVKAATGEEVTDHEMGGSQVHCYESGVGDNEVKDDAECIATVRRFLSYLPSSNTEAPPSADTGDPADRDVEGLERIVPVN